MRHHKSLLGVFLFTAFGIAFLAGWDLRPDGPTGVFQPRQTVGQFQERFGTLGTAALMFFIAASCLVDYLWQTRKR